MMICSEAKKCYLSDICEHASEHIEGPMCHETCVNNDCRCVVIERDDSAESS